MVIGRRRGDGIEVLQPAARIRRPGRWVIQPGMLINGLLAALPGSPVAGPLNGPLGASWVLSGLFQPTGACHCAASHFCGLQVLLTWELAVHVHTDCSVMSSDLAD